MNNNKLINLIFLPFFYLIFCFSLFSNSLYKENQNYYNLFNYRENSIFSKIYFRNLLSFYFFDEKQKPALLEFLKTKEPSFYWIAKQLWEEKNQNSYNPTIAIWQEYLNISKTISYPSLRKKCDYFGNYFCQWLEDMDFLYNEYYLNKRKLNSNDLEIILKRLRPYLTQNVFIPFMYRTAPWLPNFLNDIGLVVESSILLNAMISRESPQNQNLLRKEFVKSLVFSGNPEYAFKVIQNFQLEIEENYFNSFNILLFSLNPDFIINNLEKNFLKKIYKGQIDLWTGFPISNNLIQIRIQEIKFWKNQNSDEVIYYLENLLKQNDLSELEKQYLRLIQSKILYNKNIDLAQKITEDVQFKSQAKDLYLLEYYATLWNGWCLYKQNQHYPANIEFTKAYNIANKHFPKISKYSTLLGLLLTKKKFGITDLSLIKELLLSFPNYLPEKELFYFIEWIPEDVPFDIWKELYIEFLNSTKNYKSLFEFIINEYNKDYYFKNSKNPGGIIGLYTTFLWKRRFQNIQENYKFNYKNSNYINFINFINKNPIDYIFFLKTYKNSYIILFSNKSIILQKWENINENDIQKNIVEFLKNYSPKKELEIVLNPEFNLFFSYLINSLDLSRTRFSLVYLSDITNKKPIQFFGYKNEIENQQFCNLEDILNKNFIILPKNYRIYPEYPFLVKFQCNENEFFRLWDMERFLSNNIAILVPNLINQEEFNMLLLVSTKKNWFLELTHPISIRIKNFEF